MFEESQQTKRESNGPYENWSDSQRMEEYAHTGDPSCLTPEIARKMQVTPEAMREVPGSSTQDIADADAWYEASEAIVDSEINELLKPFGADNESLEQKNIHEQFRALLNAATTRVSDTRSEEGFDNETLRDEAMQRLLDIALNQVEGMYRLFEVLQLDTTQGLRDIQVVEDLIAHLKIAYEDGSGHARAALEELLDVADRILEMEFHPKVNYLGGERLAQLLRGESGKEAIKSDVDMYVPFEITDGVYAVFSSDGDRIFVADKEMSDDIKNIVRSGWTKEYQGEEGHDLPSYQYEYIPEDLMYSINEVIDAGTPLDEIANEIGVADPDIVKDYITILRSSSREIIETKFGFRLTSLNIKEQLYFLNYLKNTTVEQAQTMQSFTSLYGNDGMRTFLSLEQGDETLGDHIVVFGQHEDVASTIFKYYGELLNLADQIEDGGVRERVLARAQKDLETAVRAHDPETIAERLHTYVAEAKVEVALIQEGIKEPLSSTNTTGLASDLPERMQAISAKNYSKESPEFQELMREGMAAKLNEPNRRWYVDQTDGGEIIFFDSFTDVLNEETGEVQYKTFEAVNLGDDKYGGAGAARLKQTLGQELADGLPMQAFSDPENPVSQLYIEHGFVAVGTVSPAGKFSFELWRNSESSELLQTKQLSIAELIVQIENPEKTGDFTIRTVENGDRFPELSDGQCLTRYFKHNGQQYVVFEPVPVELQNGFVLAPEEQSLAA
jgi:hypothetical protein